ncbi:signal transduction histidine kinase [Deinococcus metalli]|uniref:histidine kinase n=1 Tax=Deinococcus metalli TaxID=1141878 RepID=A0A7W8KIF9_9DEIO|nr:HAMP domain-containing sensor histidine kinase [Deinococcus metalli]MBB5378480.1 signal transduction histidine kinase [Deinococcus metalli]GHF58027.1 two-component sensor histidine kinase [Deinococcus metalli]
MRLFPRLLLHHLTVVVVMAVVLVAAAEVAAHPFIGHHVDQMVRLIGPQGARLRPDLYVGMRATLTWALLTALPLALGVAALAAWVAARQVTASVRTLQDGSRALAAGEYGRRLPEGGQDELAQLAHSFNVLAGALERVEQSRVELIGNVAHELRTPVSAVRGYVEAAQDGILPVPQALQAVAREVAGMERLVGDLSLVSRVEAGRVELRVMEVDVAELLAQVQERFVLAFEERGVTLAIRRPAEDLVVPLDPERAHQILANLLRNALSHTPRGGTVRVDVRREGRGVAVTVSDTGAGIAPEHLERIFERFFRADAARTRGEGSGVGLTISRGLARAMGGELGVRSAVGRGSTFTWTLVREDRASPALRVAASVG